MTQCPPYARVSSASKTKLIQRRQNLSLQSTFPVKIYQPEEGLTKGQISDKDVECFLCLVVSIISSEKEYNNSSYSKNNKNRSSRPEVSVL